ncbi:MAG: phage tail tape measure C-terminal domain-containing protein [Planctomycetota bacterium]
MATGEKRTLEILAKVTDQASRPLLAIGQGVKKAFGDGARQGVEFAKSIVSVRTAVTALVGGFAAFRGGQFVNGIAASVDELAKLARGTGSTVDRLQTLQNAFKLSDIEGDRFRALLASLTKSVGTALTDGTSKAAKQLGQLGLTFEDLRTSDPVKLFDRLAGSLERFTTPQEKAAAIVEIFPKMAGEVELLVDVLGQGQASFRNLVATAEFFGGTLTKEATDSVVRFNGSMDLLKLSIDRVGRSATVAIAERLAPIIERIATFVAQNGDRIGEAIGQLVASISQLVLLASAAVVRFAALLSSNGEKIIETIESIWVVGEPLGKLFRDLFNARSIVPGARALRDEMEQVADKVASARTETTRLLQVRDQMARLPGESGPEQQAQIARQIEESERQRLTNYERLLQLQEQFNQAQKRGGGATSGDEIGRQMQAAEMRQTAATLASLASFDNLPSPPTDLAPIMKALFGAGGPRDADTKTRSFIEGVSDGLDRAKQRWQDFGAAGEEAVSRIVDGGLNGLTDAFADIITGQKSAKEAFRDLAKTMLAELARIISKLLIMRTLQMFLGPTASVGATFETGGVYPGEMQGTVPFRKFAMGGVVKRPTLALFGEGSASRGEAFVPLPDGRRIPVALSGGGGSTMNITIQAMDGADVTRVLLQNRGTLRAVWQHDVSRVRAVRQNVAGAAR